MYKKGTLLVDRNGVHQYEKLGDDEFDWWVFLTATYVHVIRVDTKTVYVPFNKNDPELELPDDELADTPLDPKKYRKETKTNTVWETRPESDKPLYRKDKNDNDVLNRYGWKWSDEMVYKEFVEGRNWTVLTK